VRTIGPLDGAQPGFVPFQGAAASPDGRVWFANGTALQVFDTSDASRNFIPPPVYIQDVVAEHKIYGGNADIWFPAGTRDLQIDYTALSFRNPQKVAFRYRLEGRDHTWRDAGSRRQAFYTDLPPGHYRFRVIASNNDGVWNEQGAMLAFSIAPSWFQTVWFRLLAVFAFGFALWAIYEVRVRQIEQRFNVGLEARVNERTRIARELHDTLLQSLQGLLLRFQAASNLLPTRPEEAKQRLDTAINHAAQAITEGRDAVHELRAPAGVSNDLSHALSSLGKQLAGQQADLDGPEVCVHLEGKPRNLQPTVRDEVYRIAAEALRNAFRHARADRIEVELRYDERRFRLRVRDDGMGFNPRLLSENQPAGHWGLSGMHERAKLVGGTLEVWSELESGTEIELGIPASVAYIRPAAARWRLFSRPKVG